MAPKQQIAPVPAEREETVFLAEKLDVAPESVIDLWVGDLDGTKIEGSLRSSIVEILSASFRGLLRACAALVNL